MKINKKLAKNKWGGARKGSGPKPKDANQCKKTVVLYVIKDEIDKLGGDDAIKALCYAAIKKASPLSK